MTLRSCNARSGIENYTQVSRPFLEAARYGYLIKGQKQSQNGQSRAQEWKEREKSKPKAYLSLMGQPFFAPGDDIEFLLHRDPSTPTISVVSILEGFTDEPPLEENDDLFD
ncbi:hypothetical protein Tco_0514226 [Tanacetum coccineum]